jgi:hypothetical protein
MAPGDIVGLSTDEEDEQEELEDDDNVDEEKQPELLSFVSTWRAVAGKGSLRRVRTNIYMAGDITVLCCRLLSPCRSPI